MPNRHPRRQMLVRRFALILLLGAAGLPVGTTAATDDARRKDAAPRPCTEFDEGKDGLCGHAMRQFAMFEAERLRSPAMRELHSQTDITHCLLDIEVNPSAQTVVGSNTLNVTARTDGLAEFTLDLRSNLTVTAVTVNGAPAGYTRPTHQVVIALDQAYDVGETFQATVHYSGTPQNLNWGSFDFDTHAGTSIVASLSEPYYAHTWWPCKEAIDDKFTMDMWVTVPGWMTVASNGALQGVDALAGNRARHRWHEGYPISVYLVSVAMTNYTKWTDYYVHPNGAMPVEFYIYPEDVATVQPLVADVVTMIETFSQAGVFGEYPFIDEKYGIAQFNWCCGMEHQTITSQGSFPERRTVHELAHSWWGNAITCASWHDIWLNEGFARYAESLWHEKKPGGSHAAYLSHMQTYRPSSYGGSVYRYDISTPDAIFSTINAYNKGSWVLHMLRHVIGDASFFGALAQYRAAYEGLSADTPGFQAVVEGVYGQDLDWFFDAWIYNIGAPYYRYGWLYEDDGGAHRLKLHVQQTQGSYPYFRMPIDIRVDLVGGGSETHVIMNDAQEFQWYTLEISGEAADVAFDPETWILRGAADEVAYIAEPPEPTPNDVIVEARNSAGAVTPPPAYVEDGAWADSSIKSSVPGLSGTGSRFITYTLPNTGTDNATFVPPVAVPGEYEVFVTWDVGANCYDAQYTIRHALGESVQLVDQIPDGVSGANANTWVPLGAYWFRAGQAVGSGSVNVSEETVSGRPHTGWNYRVYADAAKWAYVADWPTGDADLDGDVDADDFAALADCVTGPGVPYADPNCVILDWDGDDDVDLVDLGQMQTAAAPGS